MEVKNDKKSNLPYIILAVVAVLFIAITALYFIQNKQMNEIVTNLNVEKTILTEEYQSLIQNYDSLQSDNDTINVLLEREREKISQLIEEIKTVKATNTAKIREFQKELSSLRGVLKSYVVQIDSLNARNQELTRENVEHKRRYTQIETSFKELEVEKATLAEKVSIASRLDVTNMLAEAMNSNGKKTERSSRTAKIRVCFTVLRNVTSPIGMKTFYLRIERPDGQLLMN
jgi:chromosome segregation ATPase